MFLALCTLTKVDTNRVIHSQRHVALLLNIPEGHVSKAFAELAAAGLLIDDPLPGTSQRWRISAATAWKGTGATHRSVYPIDAARHKAKDTA